MKKLFTILCLLLCVASFAQTLAFRGIDMTGKTLSQVEEELKTKGFQYISTDNSVKVFKGSYAGLDIDLVLSGINPHQYEETALATQMVVFVKDQYTFSDAYKNYTFLKDAMTRKFGSPFNEIEEFKYPYDNNPSTNDKEIAYRHDYLTFRTTWIDSQSTVTLLISSSTNSVAVNFVHDKQKEKAKDELQKKIDSDL